MNLEWIYMCDNNLCNKIGELLDNTYDIEIWEELGIIEISKDKSSLDFELVDKKHWDDMCTDVLNELGYNSMYLVTIQKDAQEWAKEMMQKICISFGGRFCADTEDLMPYIE